MLGLAEPIQNEYKRWVEIIGEHDPYVSPNTLGIQDVLRAHFLIADFFYALGEGLGGIGPLSVNLLHSALSRQQVGFGGKTKWTSSFELCATLLYGLIMDHPFQDANKRTAFLSCLYLLQKQGRCPTISHKMFEDFTVEVAQHAIKNRRRYMKLKSAGTHDPEVLFISKYLKQNTRAIDKREYFVTHRELKGILNNFGFDLDNPSNNFIDVVKVERKRRLFGNDRSNEIRTRVGRIGFPSWTKQVSKKDVAQVRRLTNLVPKFGVDSQSFYRGIDDMKSLIAMYQDPLRRLAYR